jgi:hypothetical protein
VSNPVIVEDLEARFRSLTAAEQTVAEALLDDAWAVLLMTIPDLEDRITAGTVSDEAITFVVSAMVLRVLRNPNGVRSWSVDDYSETRDNSLSAGSLYASPDEVRLLTGRASSLRRGAFSVVPAQPASAAPGSESEYVEYLRSGSPYGTFPVPPGSWS